MMQRPDDGYRDVALARRLMEMIRQALDGAPPIRLMEVCGTHTVAIARFGLRRAAPPNLELLSGPGCPVCVTPGGYIDAAARLALAGVTVVTFGDMVRVPGNTTSLEDARARGGNLAVVSSAGAALDLARRNHGEVVFLGVGFETTAPTVAAVVMTAARQRIGNFSVLSAHKLVPPALRLLLNDPACAISGFILPGHVSTIIGTRPYDFLADEFRVPGVIAGFELVDVVAGVYRLVRMVRAAEIGVQNEYTRVVHEQGNPAAWAAVTEVFDVTDAVWRGIGTIPQSGLALKSKYRRFDAAARHGIEVEDSAEPDGCSCGAVLRGFVRPVHCPLFAKRCTPDHPVGPCMVSLEGACAASYRYGER